MCVYLCPCACVLVPLSWHPNFSIIGYSDTHIPRDCKQSIAASCSLLCNFFHVKSCYKADRQDVNQCLLFQILWGLSLWYQSNVTGRHKDTLAVFIKYIDSFFHFDWKQLLFLSFGGQRSHRTSWSFYL